MSAENEWYRIGSTVLFIDGKTGKVRRVWEDGLSGPTTYETEFVRQFGVRIPPVVA